MIGQRSPFSVTPGVRRLIAVNAVVYLLAITVFTGPWFLKALAFSPSSAMTQPWTFVTYMFVHGGLLHLAFNMLMLFFFGPAVEDRMGTRAFLTYYVIAGLGGAALSFVIALFGTVAPFVGASGAVFGVALAFALHWPDAPIYVFPLPVPIRAKWLVVILASVDLALAVSGANDGVAHLAHLGGFIAGFLYLRGEALLRHQAGQPWVEPRRSLAPALTRPRTGERRERSLRQPVESGTRDTKASEVNRLLDKISAGGIDSLTAEERRFLNEVSRELRQH
ncbi:MAG TPA: rhomboid family intramembrane serine protease [Gemmatimonadales bacterium]|nr:rhomboid family intramembrane serine protease [Gemmatimonadales bacterium]